MSTAKTVREWQFGTTSWFKMVGFCDLPGTPYGTVSKILSVKIENSMIVIMVKGIQYLHISNLFMSKKCMYVIQSRFSSQCQRSESIKRKKKLKKNNSALLAGAE